MAEISKGKIVRSKAGRDRDRFFVVLDVEGDFATVADGKVRPLCRPKRKRLKHLAPTLAAVEADSIRTDKQLKKLLANYNQDPRICACHTGGNELVKK